MKPTPAQRQFIEAVLRFIKKSPDLHDFAYSMATGKTEALKMLEKELHKACPGRVSSRRNPYLVNRDWFGKGCEHLSAQWEDNEQTAGPDYQEAEPVLVFCRHPENVRDHEGNCTQSICPVYVI